MGFWNLFSAGDTVEKTADAIISAGDKLVYTAEEKADMNFKTTQLHIQLLEAYHPFKVTQRVLAFWYSFLFGMAFISGVIMAVINTIIEYRFIPTEDTPEAKLLNVDHLIAIVSAFGMFGIVMAIVSFYFAGGTLESIKRTFGKK